VKHAALLGALLLALVGCQSVGEADADRLRWQTARVASVLEAHDPEAARAANLCGGGAFVKVGYYRGGTRFYQVRPQGDIAASVGQSIRFDRTAPCGAVQLSTSR
jgi:hypothetical protein